MDGKPGAQEGIPKKSVALLAVPFGVLESTMEEAAGICQSPRTCL